MYSKIIDSKQRQAGKRYENYIGYILRNAGWDVKETGRDGINDHGIDLIATKDGITRYVQCKGLSWWKTVYENVVSQLFGSVAAVEGIKNIENVEMYIYSPAKIADYAQSEADKLHISYVRIGYPRWRRNK